ncbi:LytTR family DNA-binding domain-containing protein [Petroclostridium sp. X23]|uniref:LytTR family DNA-binding domain-containing protein n=1 Tax=Petroclostridium sp. X23 TaxID=3045146 RepID=UPI0024ACEB05|nr:LytTR family DNA-binding domain-containing protein [Petroclostridium sp. X23]WHH58636.1 LytTR family DNA-binding domain-containing protein [Petroclostridium sp. X23]
MKYVIDENETYEDVEIIIKCKKCDDSILSLISRLKMQNEKIIGVINEKTFVLDPKDILYFESVDKKSFIYTKDEVYESSLRLYEIEKILQMQGFIRATKSTIINISKIKSIKTEFNSTLTVEMENHEKLAVSRQYAPILKERLVQ